MSDGAGAGALIMALVGVVGSADVLVDDDVRGGFESDWTGRFHGRAAAVVRPADAAEVSAVVRACREHATAIVPQGGNTGLVGGGVPRGEEVVVSLGRLGELSAIDHATGTVVAGAGVTLAALQTHARAYGYEAGIDFAARDSATVGGIVATDAGGIRAVRYGTARARVAGLQAVLGGGQIVNRLSAVPKDNAGYDLSSLLIGSEGTLGIITAVRWRLTPYLAHRVAVLIPVESIEQAAELFVAFRARLTTLEAAEFFTDDGLQLVVDHLGTAPPPFRRQPVYLLIECADRRDPFEELAEVLGDLDLEHGLVAQSEHERHRMWRYREAQSESIGVAGIPHKIDVGVPIAELPGFAAKVVELARGTDASARVILFGHLGDGNVHVNVLGPDPSDDSIDALVLQAAADAGGTISAEHGVGTLKPAALGLVRGDDEIAAMWAVKRALDPELLLNPGVVLRAEPRSPSAAE